MVAPERIVVIGVDTAHRSIKEHRLYDPRVKSTWRVLPAEMVANIREIGVQSPILCEVDDLEGSESIIVYEGRGRVLCARKANEELVKAGLPPKTVPVIASRANAGNVGVHDLVSIAANEMRHADSPFSRAEKAQHLLDTQHSEATVALMFGVTVAAIHGWLDLLRLSPKVRRACERGEVAVSAAAVWSKFDHADQEEKLARLLERAGAGKKPTTKAAKDAERGWTTPGRKDLKRVAARLSGLAESGLGSADYTAGYRDALEWAAGEKASPDAVNDLLLEAKEGV